MENNGAKIISLSKNKAKRSLNWRFVEAIREDNVNKFLGLLPETEKILTSTQRDIFYEAFLLKDTYITDEFLRVILMAPEFCKQETSAKVISLLDRKKRDTD